MVETQKERSVLGTGTAGSLASTTLPPKHVTQSTGHAHIWGRDGHTLPHQNQKSNPGGWRGGGDSIFRGASVTPPWESKKNKTKQVYIPTPT